MADDVQTGHGRPKRLASVRPFISTQARAKQEIKRKLKKVKNILKKTAAERTEDEISTLHELPEVVKTAEKNAERILKQKERILEIEDEPDVLDRKCLELAQMLRSAKNAIVYTGAGISTAASIPDYRGPNGVWTLLKKGQALKAQDLVDAEPTYSHMCITKLFKEGLVKQLVSQNCDGLHIRSGFPRQSLSEVHGNMFIEICKNCKPQKEHVRLFDVTERTAKGRHKTGRTCSKCWGSLCDTIVHFGEKGGLLSPYKWRQAAKAARKSDLIICLGSSLKVLRCYPCLWRMDIRPEHRPKLVIINLQWTPKDDSSILKIHGRCDDVLRRVAGHLGLEVPVYRRETDPLFKLHTPVKTEEKMITSKGSLECLTSSQQSRAKKTHNRAANNKPFAHHQPSAMKLELKAESDSLNQGLLFGLSTVPPCTSSSVDCVQSQSKTVCKTEQTACKMEQLACKTEQSACKTEQTACETEQSHTQSEIGRILDPVRLKLEEMLKSKGLWKETKETANGKVSPAEKTPESIVSSKKPSSSSPISSTQDHLPQSTPVVSVAASYPQLRTLLNIIPSEPSGQDHDIFRVDLSTNPISITRTHCPSAESMSVDLSAGSDSSCGQKSSSGLHATAKSLDSNYAKLLRKIQFDHSYCKNPHKTRSSGKKPDSVSDSSPCSADPRLSHHLVQGSDQLSGQSFVPVCLDTSDLTIAQQNLGFILNDHDILSAVWQVIGSLPDNLELVTSENHNHSHQHHPLRNCESSKSQEIFISMHPGETMHSQSSLQPHLSAMHAEQSANSSAIAVLPSVLCPGDHSAGNSTREGGTGDIKHFPNNVDSTLTVKQKATVSASVPGWFGKGLRVRRKRTL